MAHKPIGARNALDIEITMFFGNRSKHFEISQTPAPQHRNSSEFSAVTVHWTRSV